MSAPVVQGVGTGSETSCSWPTHASGDLGLLFVETASGTVTTPAGWTVLPGTPAANTGGTTKLSVFYRLAASSSESAASLAGGTDHLWGTIITARGVDQTHPIAAVANNGSGGAGTSIVLPGLATFSADNLVFQAISWAIDDAGGIASGWTNGTLTSFAEQYDAGTITGNGGGVAVGAGTISTAGTVGTGTVTITSSAVAMVTIAVQPPQSASGGISRARLVNG